MSIIIKLTDSLKKQVKLIRNIDGFQNCYQQNKMVRIRGKDNHFLGSDKPENDRTVPIINITYIFFVLIEMFVAVLETKFIYVNFESFCHHQDLTLVYEKSLKNTEKQSFKFTSCQRSQQALIQRTGLGANKAVLSGVSSHTVFP